MAGFNYTGAPEGPNKGAGIKKRHLRAAAGGDVFFQNIQAAITGLDTSVPTLTNIIKPRYKTDCLCDLCRTTTPKRRPLMSKTWSMRECGSKAARIILIEGRRFYNDIYGKKDSSTIPNNLAENSRIAQTGMATKYLFGG